MELKSNEDLIVELKKVLSEKSIGPAELGKIMEEHKHPIAKTTIQRFFKEGSEVNDSFRYKDTLKPMAEIFLPDKNQSSDEIAELKEKIENLSKQIAEIYEMASKGMSFMRSQIDLKDTRMERKDAWIQEQRDEILELREENKRLEEDIHRLLEKCNNCERKK